MVPCVKWYFAERHQATSIYVPKLRRDEIYFKAGVILHLRAEKEEPEEGGDILQAALCSSGNLIYLHKIYDVVLCTTVWLQHKSPIFNLVL